MRSGFRDLGIDIPLGAAGEVRAVCPECLQRDGKAKQNLAVNADEGIFFCHRCQWKGSLKGSDRDNRNPAKTAARAAERKREKNAKAPYYRRKLIEAWRGRVPLTDSTAVFVLRYLDQRLGGRALAPRPIRSAVIPAWGTTKSSADGGSASGRIQPCWHSLSIPTARASPCTAHTSPLTATRRR